MIKICSILIVLIVFPGRLQADENSSVFAFRDVAESSGLLPSAKGIHGHGAAWGDVDGDSFPDLYIGTFHKAGTKRNFLFHNEAGEKFTPVEDENLRISSRATGIVFADLDNDGDMDLYVASMPKAAGKKSLFAMRGCSLFENTGGKGKVEFADRSTGNGACPAKFGGRSVAVLDFDGDGLLDLLVGEDPNSGYNGSPTSSTRLFRNLGGLKFEDATAVAGIPKNIPGLGVAAADLNQDTLPDIFIASADGGNILFLNEGEGKFAEAPGSRELFAWKGSGGDNMVCGICFGDLNRDGRMDAVLGQHFDKPWAVPEANRIFINRGIGKGGWPDFEEVTGKVKSPPIPLKAPHIEIQDMDNDGWPDISTSIVKFEKDGTPHPVILKNQGVQKSGLPLFKTPALSINDFPTQEDRDIGGNSGKFFDKMLAERKITYAAPGPVGDFDRDGQLDILIPSWWPETDTMLLRNETKTSGAHWIQVSLIHNGEKVNRFGIGARVEIYPKGKLGEADALLGAREIASGFGYASGQTPQVHFGLGKVDAIDIRVVLPHNGGIADFEDQSIDREVTLVN